MKQNPPIYIVIIIGIIFHLIYLYSIFDIYFKSPLVHGMPHYSPPKSKADRLVFIVGDGLRADKFFEVDAQNVSAAKFLRSKLETEASWGISHTRVPTESRPCHIAMFAGFYEDVSAVTTGWKINPVEFDTVLNQSNYVLQIGSPDVVRMFTSKREDHFDTFYYPPEMEDFSTDSTLLDKWVFDKFDEIFEKAKTDVNWQRKLRTKKMIIFLHLLGMDTAGHAYRPGSEGYTRGIQFVDKGVEKVVRKIENFYNDNKTVFIFTADHGMTTRGSHGDGDPECTRTPFVAWGAGVRRFDDGESNIIDDGSISLENEINLMKKEWNLDHKYRKDFHQASMAPLIASLLGIPYPVNNVGVLPLSYLEGDSEYLAKNLFTNAKQIAAQYKTKADILFLKKIIKFIFP